MFETIYRIFLINKSRDYLKELFKKVNYFIILEHNNQIYSYIFCFSIILNMIYS